MKKVVVFTLLCVVVIVQVAVAGTEEGDKEIQIQGAITNTKSSKYDYDSTVYNIQLNLISFYSSYLSGGLSLQYSESGSDYTQTGLAYRIDGYLGDATSKHVPYIGGTLGLFSTSAGDSRDGGIYWGIHGGLKYFVEENISLNFELDHTEYDDFEVNMFFTGFSYIY